MNLRMSRDTIYAVDRMGIIESCSSYSLGRIIRSNTKLYFYPFDYTDLIEVQAKEQEVVVNLFMHTPRDAENTIAKRFDELKQLIVASGLQGKSFLFDLDLFIPIRYSIFQSMAYPDLEKLPVVCFTLSNADNVASVVDSVYLFNEDKDVDYCLLSLYNSMFNIYSPIYIQDRYAAQLISLIAGKSCGLDIEQAVEQIEGESSVFFSTMGISFYDRGIQNLAANLDTTKLREIIKLNDVKEADLIEGKVKLSEILQKGLDDIIKRIKNPKVRIDVEIDEHFEIKSMYIYNGAAFMVPRTKSTLEYFRTLLDSDNLVFVMS